MSAEIDGCRPATGIWLNRTGQSPGRYGNGFDAGSKHHSGMTSDFIRRPTQPAGTISRAPPRASVLVAGCPGDDVLDTAPLGLVAEVAPLAVERAAVAPADAVVDETLP
jgi:hypothetical protein